MAVEVAPVVGLDLVEHPREFRVAGAVAGEVEAGQGGGETLAEIAGIDRAPEASQVLDRQGLEAARIAPLRDHEDLAAERPLLHQRAGGEQPGEAQKLDRLARSVPHRHGGLRQGQLAGEARGHLAGLELGEQRARLLLPALDIGEGAQDEGRLGLPDLAAVEHPPQHGGAAAGQGEGDTGPGIGRLGPGLRFDGEEALLDMHQQLPLGEVSLRGAPGDPVLQELQGAHQFHRQSARRDRQGFDGLWRLAAMAAAAMPIPGREGLRRDEQKHHQRGQPHQHGAAQERAPVRGPLRRRPGGGAPPGSGGIREGRGPPHSGVPRSRISIRRFSAAFGSGLRGCRSA